MQVIAKTTGTVPRMIFDNQTEEPIVRLGMANIREQIRMIAQARTHNAQAIVFECMALRPDLQRIESLHIIQPTIVVITNVRPDHLDVMGPGLADIRKAYIDALPPTCVLFTTDRTLAQECKKRPGIECIHVNPSMLDDNVAQELKNFPYIEHDDNVALALSVCDRCGISIHDALQHMKNVQPDPGALRYYTLHMNNKKIDLVYAMAANDPESTRIIWNKVNTDSYQHIHLLINCRKDRLNRSLQFIEMIRDIAQDAISVILTGEGTEILLKKLKKSIAPGKVFDIGNKNVDQASSLIASHVAHNSVVFAIGNTVGYGMNLIKTIVTKGTSTC